MKGMTAKMAKETVRESYPESVCRFGWQTINGVREEYYEVYPNRSTMGRFIGKGYRAPRILSKATTKSGAWVAAAQRIIDAIP